MQRIFLILRWAAVAAYLVSFLLPVVNAEGGRCYYGWSAFLMSFLSIFDGVRSSGHIRISLLVPLAWCANPIFWVSLYCSLRGQFACSAKAAAVAVVLALPLLFLEGSPLLEGYWLWLASMAMLAVSGFALSCKTTWCIRRSREGNEKIPS